MSRNDIFYITPCSFNYYTYFNNFNIVVPFITVSNLGVANYRPNINPMLAIDAYNNTPFSKAFIPTYPPFFFDEFAIIAFYK